MCNFLFNSRFSQKFSVTVDIVCLIINSTQKKTTKKKYLFENQRQLVKVSSN